MPPPRLRDHVERLRDVGRSLLDSAAHVLPYRGGPEPHEEPPPHAAPRPAPHARPFPEEQPRTAAPFTAHRPEPENDAATRAVPAAPVAPALPVARAAPAVPAPAAAPVAGPDEPGNGDRDLDTLALAPGRRAVATAATWLRPHGYVEWDGALCRAHWQGAASAYPRPGDMVRVTEHPESDPPLLRALPLH
ncbi:hypothetical protein ACFYNX_04410 [Streptomyces sp. NPDC007872]|uniref:hypothetical protein n=1 Tax=Streptomyces sp. NPDC007872 TaxID=3364782 RepID=UPI003681AC17